MVEIFRMWPVLLPHRRGPTALEHGLITAKIAERDSSLADPSMTISDILERVHDESRAASPKVGPDAFPNRWYSFPRIGCGPWQPS
jgi:hypothetical protein